MKEKPHTKYYIGPLFASASFCTAYMYMFIIYYNTSVQPLYFYQSKRTSPYRFLSSYKPIFSFKFFGTIICMKHKTIQNSFLNLFFACNNVWKIQSLRNILRMKYAIYWIDRTGGYGRGMVSSKSRPFFRLWRFPLHKDEEFPPNPYQPHAVQPLLWLPPQVVAVPWTLLARGGPYVLCKYRPRNETYSPNTKEYHNQPHYNNLNPQKHQNHHNYQQHHNHHNTITITNTTTNTT